MKFINKFKNFKNFCEINPNFIKFPSIQKDIQTIQRLDKISIFEYFNIIEPRVTSKPNQFLVKEIVDYVHSENFKNEFKYTFSNEEKKFKFILLNLGLIANRIENSLKEDQLSFINYLKNLILNKETNFYRVRLQSIFCYKYLTLKNYCKDILKFHIAKNQIKNVYSVNYFLEEEFLKKFYKIDFSSLRIKKEFIKDLNKIEENENKFKEKYIKKFLLNLDKENVNELEIDKLFLYFIAHVKEY